jgi:predicted nucleotidyltransferase
VNYATPDWIDQTASIAKKFIRTTQSMKDSWQSYKVQMEVKKSVHEILYNMPDALKVAGVKNASDEQALQLLSTLQEYTGTIDFRDFDYIQQRQLVSLLQDIVELNSIKQINQDTAQKQIIYKFREAAEVAMVLLRPWRMSISAAFDTPSVHIVEAVNFKNAQEAAVTHIYSSAALVHLRNLENLRNKMKDLQNKRDSPAAPVVGV